MKRFTVPAAVEFLLAPTISKPKVLAAARRNHPFLGAMTEQ